MSDAPHKFQLFLRLVKDQLYFNDPDDNLVVFDSKNLFNDGISESDVKQFKLFLESKNIVSQFNYWEGHEDAILPVSRKDKMSVLNPGFWRIFFGPNPGEGVIRFIFEISSRDRFLEFYKEINKLDQSSHPIVEKQDFSLSFDSDKSILYFHGQKILISKKTDKTNGHYVLEYIFNNPEGFSAKSNYAEIYDHSGDKLKPYSWKMYYRACEDIQEKAREGTPERIEDFLVFKSGDTGWTQINPKYLNN